MTFLQTIVVAFSTFSAIPMPYVEWNEKNTKYMLLAFPWIGFLIGFSVNLTFLFSDSLHVSPVFTSIFATFIPIIITGGIHLDGYCDTIDAQSSHQSKERKLEILSDPHLGTFAVIALISYVCFTFSLYHEFVYSPKYVPYFIVFFMLSRSFSAFSVVSLPSAKKSGLSSTFSQQADTYLVRNILLVYIISLFSILCYLHLISGLCFILTSFLVFCWWKRFIVTPYHGITGDLVGYFTEKIEFYYLFTLFLLQKGGFL